MKKNRVGELVVNKFFWFLKECIMNVVDLGHNDSHPLFLLYTMHYNGHFKCTACSNYQWMT